MSPIRVARVQQGLTLDEASKALGVHLNTLARYERGEHQVPMDVLARMADLYGLSMDELAGRPTPCPHALPRKRKGA